MSRRALSALLALLAPLSADAACGDPAAAPPAQHLLFIGNSLTYTNDLPGTVAWIATVAGLPAIHAAQATSPGVALIDLVKTGDAPRAIAQGPWHFVILQQGPTTHQVCHDTLVLALQALDRPIRDAGGRPAVLMTWPATSDTAGGVFDIVRESFQTAARAVDALFLPAGEAWRIALQRDPSLTLYGTDGYHPAPLGTYLTALVIYERVTGEDARSLPLTDILGRLPASEAQLRILHDAAHEANVTYGAGTVPGRPLRQDTTPIRC